ncbi:glycosyltransferase family 4 protein [Flavobacterium sp.]
MRVLMFGWEFPPHISGGLGTACFGIVSALLNEKVDVLFVVPRLYGDEDQTKFRFIDASQIKVNFKESFFNKQLRKLSYIEVKSPLLPYISPSEFVNNTQSENNINSMTYSSSMQFKFSGNYGTDLMNEVSSYALTAVQIATENKFDIIHAHDWLTFPAAILAKEKSGKPLIVHVHATEFDRSGTQLNQEIYEIEKKGMMAADAVIAVSTLTKKILVDKYEIPAQKITVVHNGIIPNANNLKHIYHHLQKDKIVVFLGRITFQKGPDYFVEAAHKVLDKFPEVQFVMAGSGDMLAQMITRVAALKMGSQFHFTGFLSEKERDHLFSISDVYVLPSVSEPFGLSVLEAIQSGVPVIISKQSGVSEVIKGALKVDFWDVDALADAIYGMLQYSALSTTFTRENKKEITNLNWSNASHSIATIYEHLIQN